MKEFYHIVSSVEKIQKIKTPKMAKINKGKLIFLSKCAVWDSKKLRFIK